MAAAARVEELGVFLRDRARSLVAVSDDGELAVALRETVSPHLALVRDVRPHECDAALRACEPWPWMVVARGSDVPPGLVALVRQRPALLLWLGAAPAGLPTQALCVPRYRDLVARVEAALHARVGPMRLAPGDGVLVEGSQAVIRSAALEALVASHPDGFDLPVRAFRAAARALRSLGLPWAVRRDPVTLRVVLVPLPVRGEVPCA